MQITAGGQAIETATEWVAVCAIDQLEPLWGEAALVDGEQVAIVLMPDGRVYAVGNRDPATGAFVMSRGIVGSRGDRHTIASPLHKQVYDLETGECFSSAEFALRTYPVDVDDGMVHVGLARGRRDATARPDATAAA